MCGREIVVLYRLSVPASPERNLPGRYNICPTDTIDAVVERGGNATSCRCVGADPVMVEEKGQGDSRDVQRPRGDGHRKGDALIDVRDKEGVLRRKRGMA